MRVKHTDGIRDPLFRAGHPHPSGTLVTSLGRAESSPSCTRRSIEVETMTAQTMHEALEYALSWQRQQFLLARLSAIISAYKHEKNATHERDGASHAAGCGSRLFEQSFLQPITVLPQATTHALTVSGWSQRQTSCGRHRSCGSVGQAKATVTQQLTIGRIRSNLHGRWPTDAPTGMVPSASSSSSASCPQ